MAKKEKKDKEGKKIKWKKPVLIAAVVVLIGGVIVVRAAGGGNKNGGLVEMTVEERNIISYLEFSGNVEAVNTANVYADASAKITEVLVEEGNEVKAGDVLAVLDTGDVEYNIKLKELALNQSRLSNGYSIRDSQASLDNLNEQVDQGLNSSLNSAQKSLLNAQDSYHSAVEKYNTTKAEYEARTTDSVVSARQTLNSQQASYTSAESQHAEGKMTDETFETYVVSLRNAEENYYSALEDAKQGVEDAYDDMIAAKEAFEDAQRDYETSQLSVEQNVENYENALEKAKALADTESSEMELEHLKESLEDYTICAPIDGYITQLSLKAGEYTTSAMAVAEITNFETMQVAVKIDEYDSKNVKEGDPVEIYVDALELTYEGKISRISKTATIQNDVSYLDAIVEFDADDQVSSGFSAEVKLVREQALCVPALQISDISYDEDNTAYVFVKDEKGEVIKRSVALGASDGTWVEIKEGLSVGDEIFVTLSTLGMTFPQGEGRFGNGQ